MRNKRALGWFLFGLGGQLQIVASLSITEAFVLVTAICIAAKEFPYMKKNGIMPFFWLSVALFLGGGISGIVNHTRFDFLVRGMAVLTLLPCSIIVCHWMLRKDMENFKWSLIGGALSGILSTFILQNAYQRGHIGGGYEAVAAEDIMNGPLWLVHRVGDLVLLYPTGWYLSCPLLLSAMLPVGFALFALLTSVSGRGTFVRSIYTAALVLIGGKKQSKIKTRVCNRFFALAVLGGLLVFGLKGIYQYTASSGILGEAARIKYESQTRGDKSIGALLLGGRMESFCGLIACIDKPIIGFGPWAMDRNGYIGAFLSKYGTQEDYYSYFRSQLNSNDADLIPCHSYIVEFWCWYGIMGLIFWIYVMYLLVRYLKQDCYAVPQCYMWIAAGVPSYFWNVFFNPFAARVGSMMFVVACLMVRAVRLGRQQLPIQMQMEILRMERE